MSPVQVSCPGCQTTLRFPAEQLGKRVRCPKCKDVFPAAADRAGAAAAPTPAVAAAPAEDADKAFFTRLAEAKDPLAKPAPEPAKPKPEAKPPVIPGAKPGPKTAAAFTLDDEPKPPSRGKEPGQPPAKTAPTRPRPARRRDDEDDRGNAGGSGMFYAVIAGLALFVVGGLGLGAIAAYSLFSGDSPKTDTAANTTPTGGAAEPEKPKPEPAKGKPAEATPAPPGVLTDAMVAKVKKATVYIRVTYTDGKVSSGSGFFVANSSGADGVGRVVTNAHVVGRKQKTKTAARVRKIEVVVNSGEADTKTLVATVAGADPDADLALLQVTTDDLPEPLVVGDTAGLRETHEVYIFGFPLGEQLGKNITVSKSSVSSLRRGGGVPEIQVNGGMHPGNSGGPVTDTSGKVVGVAAAGILGTQINFAIPAESVKSFIRSVEKGGPVAVAPPGHPGPDDAPEPPRPAPRPVDPPPFQPPPPPFPRPNNPDAGPPKPKMTFPPVTALEITPVAISRDTVGLTLPGKVTDACVGGGGRYWFLVIPATHQLAVFDATTGRVAKFLPIPGENVRVAAGMNKLVVADTDAGQLVRYDLKTFEKEVTVKVPVPGTVQRLALGSASGGPLLVQYQRAAGGPFDSAGVAFLDLASFKEFDPGQATDRVMSGRTGIQFRASPDGRVVTAWGGGSHFWYAYTLAEAGSRMKAQHEPGVVVSPAEGGTLIASNGLYGPDVKLLGKKDPSHVLRVPAQQGPAYLTITPDSPPRPFPRPNDPPVGMKVTVHMLGDERPLHTLADPGVTIPFNFSWEGPAGLQMDRRVLFCPAANLIAFLADTDNRIVMHRFNLDAAMAKSGVDYLYVASRPPAAEAGKTFRYAVDVKSKKGGVRVKVETGPDGMTASGTVVTWDVPKGRAAPTERVTLSVTDVSGQEVYHTFTLAVKDE